MKEEFKAKVVRERMREKQKELLGHLNSWIGKTNAENAFVSFAVFLITRWLAERLERGSASSRPALVEFAAFHLYPYFGNTNKRSAPAIASVIALIEELKEGRTIDHISSGDRGLDAKLAEIVSHVQFYLEDVRGTSYLTQAREQIESVHGPFEERYRNYVGIGPKRAVELLYAIQKQLSDNFEATRKQASEFISAHHEASAKTLNAPVESGDDMPDPADAVAFVGAISSSVADQFPVAREQLASLPNPPSPEEWAGLIRLLGLTVDVRKTMAGPLDVKLRPIFVLPNLRLFFVDLSSVLDELFSAYERTAKADQQFFSGAYHKNQKVWMEGKVAEFLKRIFQEKHVFVGLDYPNPDKPGDTAEMDAAIEWGPFLVLVEAKGKQFRLLDALTDLGRLRTDLKKNVQDAFEQAERAMRFVKSTSPAVFKERKTGRELMVNRSKLRRIFKVSVTLQHLADFATQLANLKALNLFSTSDYPFSVSLADLDIITRFCQNPDVFLHYIERRLELQRSEKDVMADELNLFGTYLKTRLQPSLFWERKPDDGRPFTLMWISDGCEVFDAWHDAKLGLRHDAPEIRLAIPLHVKDLLEELRNRDDDGARWIAFALLNLSRNGADRLERLLNQIKEQHIEPGNMKSTTFVDETLVGVITVGRMVETKHLRETLFARVSVEQYRRRAKSAFGFAIELNDPFKPFDFACWAEGEWKYEPEMERVVKMMPPMKLWPGQKTPSPDSNCICGSEKRFKDCCAPFFT